MTLHDRRIQLRGGLGIVLVLVLLMLLALVGIGATSADAARIATPDEVDLMALNATQVSSDCLFGVISTVDPTWGSISDEADLDPSCPTDAPEIIVHESGGDWRGVATVTDSSDGCEALRRKVPADVLADLIACPDTAPVVPRLTIGTATTAARTRLSTHYGRSFTNSSKRWLACPSEEIHDTEVGRLAKCMFEFSLGHGRYRQGEATVQQASAGASYTTTLGDVDVVTKTLRRCSSRLPDLDDSADKANSIVDRSLSASSAVGCLSSMISDVDYLAHEAFPASVRSPFGTDVHGTDLAGFERWAAYPCRAVSSLSGRTRHYVVRCKNGLGDGFTYVFSVEGAGPPVQCGAEPSIGVAWSTAQGVSCAKVRQVVVGWGHRVNSCVTQLPDEQPLNGTCEVLGLDCVFRHELRESAYHVTCIAGTRRVQWYGSD